ncbi:Nodulin MtN3 family protein [Trifolium repens]|nr:Nodulin MtN3 family protein [Trifolium repens]
MSTAEIARTVVGIIGNVIAGCMFLSPVPTFVGICKKGSVEQFSAVPYLATLMNCMVWTLYGLPMVHPHSILVVTINGAGCVVEIIYLTLFLIYSDRKKRLKVFLGILLELIFISLLTFVSLTMFHTVNKRSAVVGTICMLFNIGMYASPLSIMKMVIKTKSVEYMPFFLSLASFGNGVSWTIYALIPFDPFIAIPNGIGTMFAVVQLILYATYYKSTKEQIAARKNSKGEMNLSELVVVGNSNGTATVQDNPNISKITTAPPITK